MTLILSGTNGVSDIDGSAATPAIRGTDANTGIFFPAADTIAFSEGGVESMRIDSSGNVGIGTGATTGYGDLTVLRQATTSTNATLSLISGTSGYGRLFFGDAQNAAGEYDGFVQYDQANRLMQFGTAQAERMRIDSSGNLLVGTTSVLNAGRISVQNSANVITAKTTGTTNNWTAFVGARDGNDGLVAAWYQNLSGSIVGTIGVTASATTYNTSSDYRLKNTISPMTGALAKVALLKPVTYKWNIDGSSSQGFIAHELQDVVPDCVTGEKDAVETYIDEDGNEQTRPKYQGVDTSFLVATLTAAIQEQQALIQSLTTRITALEAK